MMCQKPNNLYTQDVTATTKGDTFSAAMKNGAKEDATKKVTTKTGDSAVVKAPKKSNAGGRRVIFPTIHSRPVDETNLELLTNGGPASPESAASQTDVKELANALPMNMALIAQSLPMFSWIKELLQRKKEPSPVVEKSIPVITPILKKIAKIDESPVGISSQEPPATIESNIKTEALPSKLPPSILRRSKSALSRIDESSLSPSKNQGRMYGFKSPITSSLVPSNKLQGNTSSTSINSSMSSVPSLVSENSLSSFEDYPSSPQSKVTRKKYMQLSTTRKSIKFDPRVWIHLHEHTSKDTLSTFWYSQSELDTFKQDAINLIQRQNMLLMGSGTGVVFRRKAYFNHPALGIGNADSPKVENSPSKLKKYLKSEIQNVLIIDPNDLFLSLFTKSIKFMLPEVNITTAHSGTEALRRIKKAKAFTCGRAVHGYDIIIVEQRLAQPGKPSKSSESPVVLGSQLLQRFKLEEEEVRQSMKPSEYLRFSYLIGVSMDLDCDRAILDKCGANLVWSKPPPPLNMELRNNLVKSVALKRGLTI